MCMLRVQIRIIPNYHNIIFSLLTNTTDPIKKPEGGALIEESRFRCFNDDIIKVVSPFFTGQIIKQVVHNNICKFVGRVRQEKYFSV